MADELLETIRGGELAGARAALKANPEGARHAKYKYGQRSRASGRQHIARSAGRDKPVAMMSMAAH